MAGAAQQMLGRDIRDNGSRVSDVAQATPALLQVAGIVWTKPLAPLLNRFIGNRDSSLSHKIFDVAESELVDNETILVMNAIADYLSKDQ